MRGDNGRDGLRRRNGARSSQLPGIGRATAIALVGVAVSLALVASAFAWRRPTRGERKAIVAAAAAAPHAGSSRVHVSNIRVSTVGPWASATVMIYVGNAPDFATAIVHKVRRKWPYASVGTSGEWCVMPRKDRKNLGFPLSFRC